MKVQVEAYQPIHGHYPELAQVDEIYDIKENRERMHEHEIPITAQPLGRPVVKKEVNPHILLYSNLRFWP